MRPKQAWQWVLVLAIAFVAMTAVASAVMPAGRIHQVVATNRAEHAKHVAKQTKTLAKNKKLASKYKAELDDTLNNHVTSSGFFTTFDDGGTKIANLKAKVKAVQASQAKLDDDLPNRDAVDQSLKDLADKLSTYIY